MRNYSNKPRALVRRSQLLRDPKRRYVSLAIQFRIKDGANKGLLTRVYGGCWDKRANEGLGRYVGHYTAEVGWVGRVPDHVHTVEISEQQRLYVCNSWSRILLALGGRRSGKSGALAAKALIYAIIHAGSKGGILAPTYRQARNIWVHLLRMLGPVRKEWLLPGTRGVAKSDKTLRFINGASIVLMSADRDESSRSEGVAWWGIDERQDVGEEAFGNAFLSTSEGGGNYILFQTGTIPDVANRNFDDFRAHHDKVEASPKGAIYRMDSYGNPFISHDFLDDASDFLDTASIRRELHAEWPKLVGRVYYPFTEDHVKREIPFADDITAAFCHQRFSTDATGFSAAKYIIGIDPPHHAVVYRVHRGDIFHAIDEIAVDDDADIRDVVDAISERYWPAVIVIDPHETKYDKDLRRIIGKQRAQNEWGEAVRKFRIAAMRRVRIEYRVTAVRARIEKGKYYVHPRCTSLLKTMFEHQYVDRKPDKAAGLDHIGDAGGYPVVKCFPARFDYEAREEKAA